jgi:hypothetical protein
MEVFEEIVELESLNHMDFPAEASLLSHYDTLKRRLKLSK